MSGELADISGGTSVTRLSCVDTIYIRVVSFYMHVGACCMRFDMCCMVLICVLFVILDIGTLLRVLGCWAFMFWQSPSKSQIQVCRFGHLARHPVLPSTTKDAHRKVNEAEEP